MLPIDEISGIVIDEAIALHRNLGPGLFETVYETVLAGRLEARGLEVARQFPVSLEYEGHHFDIASRIDLLVDQRLVVEIKSVEQLSGATMKEGIRRMVNDHAE